MKMRLRKYRTMDPTPAHKFFKPGLGTWLQDAYYIPSDKGFCVKS